ncbi:fimbrial protein [Citrobacter sp. FP75]|uniref:fimbrial protein n=1 Tax=Citrobacter sp. FP75 TaxID=1852949 RepID=UPI001BC903FF|nr:hypothetical protein [Citrobacter sp. FP75]
MKNGFYLIGVLFLWSGVSFLYAKTITCTQQDDPWSSINSVIELTPEDVAITVGSHIPDYTVIYTQDNVNLGQNLTSCDSGAYLYETIIEQGLVSLNYVSGDYIYPTNTSGIGISISDNSKNTSLVVYPYTTQIGATNKYSGYSLVARIKFWKIPGEIPLYSGSLSVTGPLVAQILQSSGNTFKSQEDVQDRIYADGNIYIASSRKLHATLIFQPGTCEIEGGGVVVKMGRQPGVRNENSPWKDASFKLFCKDAHGYGGASAMNNSGESPFGPGPSAKVTSKNNLQNGRVKLNIIPYTAIVDADNGIIGLDGSGAKGYGIQLAWGSFSSQSDGIPVNPVLLDRSVYVSDINNNFRSTPTPIDGNAFTGGDNTIQMAARYVRIDGEVMAGTANAAIEIVASYE